MERRFKKMDAKIKTSVGRFFYNIIKSRYSFLDLFLWSFLGVIFLIVGHTWKYYAFGLLLVCIMFLQQIIREKVEE